LPLLALMFGLLVVLVPLNVLTLHPLKSEPGNTVPLKTHFSAQGATP
jgi:hypothetical protein